MARTPKKQSDEGAPITRQFLVEILAKQDERLEARMDERFRYIGALLEDMRAQNRATIEAVVSEGQTRDRQIAALRDELVPRLDVIETVVREHSVILGEHTKTLGEHGKAIAELNQKVDGLSHRVDGLSQTVDGLSQKVDAIDRKLDGKADAAIEERVAALERAAG